jgi:quaternary ammonium compound-resistance protein SugE
LNTVILRSIAMVVASVAAQIIAIGLLPRTGGFSHPVPTIGCIVAFIFSFWMVACLLHAGASLGVLVPLMSALVPLGAMLVGIAVYGETSSLPKILALVAACVLVGLASRLG